jgi:invasion protein IalB
MSLFRHPALPRPLTREEVGQPLRFGPRLVKPPGKAEAAKAQGMGRNWLKAYGKMVAAALMACAFASAACATEPPKTPAPGAQKSQDNAQAPSTPKIVRTETITYDNWTVSCAYLDRRGAKPRCSAVLRIAEKINNVPRVIFTWIIGEQKSKIVSVLSMPPGVLIAPGVDVKIGADSVKTYSYSLCASDHCEAIVPMSATIIAQLKRAPTVEVTIIGLRGQSVKFTVKTKGFQQAFAALTK